MVLLSQTPPRTHSQTLKRMLHKEMERRMETQTAIVILFLLGLILILYNLSELHRVLLEIRTELRLHNSREVRRDPLRTDRERHLV